MVAGKIWRRQLSKAGTDVVGIVVATVVDGGGSRVVEDVVGTTGADSGVVGSLSGAGWRRAGSLSTIQGQWQEVLVEVDRLVPTLDCPRWPLHRWASGDEATYKGRPSVTAPPVTVAAGLGVREPGATQNKVGAGQVGSVA